MTFQRWRSPSLEIAALVRFPLDELHLLWMSKWPNLLLFIGGMIDQYESINMHQSYSSTNSDGFKPKKMQHTTSFIYCIQMYIIYNYIHVLCLPGVQVHSFKIQNLIHQRAWRKSFPMTSVWRHQDSEMPLSAADELIHTECSSLKWRRLRPEVKSKGCLILDAACITSTPSLFRP